MDVIKFLLNTAIQITLALTRLAVAGVIWLLNKLTNRIRTKAQPKPAPQELPLAAGDVPSAPPLPPTAPDIHVHVHVTPESEKTPAPAQRTASQTTILDRPDDRIYITTGSHLMMEHPDSERLLASLDHMLYVAAHRHGKPFHLSPLDDSKACAGGLPLLPLHNELEDQFFSLERCDLPAADGAVWVRKAGHAACLVAGKA